MSCVNPNSPEFQEILKKESNFLLAELLYKKQMANQKVILYDDVRDLKTETPVNTKKEFIGETENWDYTNVDTKMQLTDQALGKLMSNPEYKITDPVEVEKFNELSNAVGEKEAYRDYFESNQNVRTSAAVINKLMDRLNNDDIDPINNITDLLVGPMFDFDAIINDFDKVVQSVNESKAIEAAVRLSNQLNIPFEVITLAEMQKLFPNQPYRKNFYQAGKVYLVAGAIDQDSVFHEFGHPIIKSMSVQNPELFQKLFDELTSTELGQSIINDLNTDAHYTMGTPEYMEEAIVRALELSNANSDIAPQGFLKNLFFQIKQFLRKIFGKKIDVSKLSSKTSLNDLIKMINYGEEFILDTDFLQKDLMVMFKTDYDQLKTQFKEGSAEKAQELMNNFYNVVKVQLSNFKAKNDIFKTIESQLADENREGILNQMQQILEGLATIGSNKLVKPLDELKITGDSALDADIIEFDSKLNAFVRAIAMADEMFTILGAKLNELKVSGVQSNQEFDQLFAIMQYNDDWLAKLESWQKEFTNYNSVLGDVAFGDNVDPVTGLSVNPLRKSLSELIDKLNATKTISDALQADSVIDILYDHLQSQLAPVKEDYLNQMAILKKAGSLAQYNRLHAQYYGVTAEEMAEFNILKSKKFSALTLEQQARWNDLQYKVWDSLEISKDALRARAEGKLGDSAKWNGLLESYMNNQDQIVGGFYSFLMKTFNTIDGNANAKRSEMLEGLEPLLKAAGFNTHILGEGKLGKDISQINRSFETDNLGKVTEYLEYRFMNNFINYDYDLQTLRREAVVARQDYNSNPSDKSKKAFNDAKKAIEKFEQDYMHRDYVQAFYDIKDKYFDSPIGEKAKEAMQDIFDRMEIIAENVNLDLTSFGNTQALNDLWTEYQRLHSVHDIYGQEKTGDAKEIADILTEFRNEISDYYEWEEREDVFENAVARYNQTLIDEGKLPKSSAHTEAMREWIIQNTTISVKEKFYQVREDMMEQRSTLVKPIQDINNNLIDVSPMYKKVFDILKPTKDNFNQFDGTQLTPQAQQEIRDVQQTIANVKERWIQLYGGTKDELRKYREIERFRDEHNGQFKDINDADFFENFWDDMSDRLMFDFELSKDDIKYIRDLDKELSNMSDSGLTPYYITTFMQLASTTDEGKKILEKTFINLDLEDGDVPTSEELFSALKTSKFIKSLLDAVPEFNTWFERNHYEQMADEYDQNTGSFVGEYVQLRPTSAWQYTIPSDLNYYETKAVINSQVPYAFSPKGYIELNGIPRIPTRAYYRRKVKEEFHTKKIDKDFVDASGNLVLANVDNRDQWLPRDYIPGDLTSAKDAKYIDGKYKQTFESNRALWDLQDHLKTSHLNNQKGLDNSQKLYLSYPRYRKGDVEEISKGWAKRKIDRVRSNFGTAVDDVELGVFTSQNRKLGYTTLTRPVGGSYKLPLGDVSTNIIDSMMDHMYSIEHFKGMRQVNSFANIFEKTMTNFATNPHVTDLEKKLQDAALLTPLSKSTEQHRIKQINSILDKHFKGEQLVKGSDVTTAKAIGNLQRWMSFTSFALDPIKSLTNYGGGKSMMWKKASEGKFYTAKDLTLTRGKSASVIAELIGTQYSNKQVSARLQLLDALNAIPGNLKKEIGSRGSKTAAQSFLGGKFFYFDRKYLNDSVPVHQFLAILSKNSFMLDGKMTSLDDAIELVDGKLRTKSGVPKDMSITYDAGGNIILGEKLKDLMNSHQSLLQKSLGISSEFTEPEIYRTLMGKFVMTMMKFFPGMLFDRYQIRTKSGKFGQRRLNYATRRAEAGTYLSAIALIQELVSNKGKFWQFDKFSWQAKKGGLQFALAYLFSMLFSMITQSIGFDDDDDGLIDFTFDPNAEGMYSKLRKSTALPALPLVSDKRTIMRSGRSFDTENYLKLQSLRLMLRIKKEEETFMPWNAIKTTSDIVMLNSPLSDGGGVKAIKDLAQSLYQTFWLEDPDVYEKAAGPYVYQEAQANKGWNIILKSAGLSGSLIDPATSLERENSDFFN